jgi:anti-sigma factor RsiW
VSCALEKLLSGYVDGDLELREMARVRDHLDSCASCARTEAELRRTVAMVRSLPNDADPPAALWDRIAAELDAPAPLWQRFLRPVSIGVGTLALAAAALVFFYKPRDPLLEHARQEFAAAEEHWAEAARELRQIADGEKKTWRPEVARAFDENLRTIDEAVERSRKAAHRPSADATAMDNLAAAYRKKIDFLEEALRTGAGREIDPL